MTKKALVLYYTRSLRRYILVLPVFLTLAICLWSVSTLLPTATLHVCVSRAYCFRSKDAAASVASSSSAPVVGNHPDALAASSISHLVVLPHPLNNLHARHRPRTARDHRRSSNDSTATPVFVNAAAAAACPGSNESTPAERNGAETEVVKLMADLRQKPDAGVWARASMNRAEACRGRKVFIYDLPSKFNTDLVNQCKTMVPWFDMCRFFENAGMGIPMGAKETRQVLVPAGRWFETHQYTLEILFHARLQEHACVTTDPAKATLFYVPYYGGLDVLRWHFKKNVPNTERDRLGQELAGWLGNQEWFRRHGGLDHVLVLGKISWDFRRYYQNDKWGSNLLQLAQMQELTKVLIERHPWHPNDIGVPHPTFFHPRTDSEVLEWQARADRRKRDHLVSFAGSPRPGQPESIRSLLINNCRNHNSTCFVQNCDNHACLGPRNTVQLFLNSHFCLQPPGDSPTRRSLFDSLIAGCIPVLFDPFTAYYQYPWHLPANSSLYSVYIPAEDIRTKRVDVVKVLHRIPHSIRDEMHRRIIYGIMPGLVYAQPGEKLRLFSDAFDITLRGLFYRAQHRLRSTSNFSSTAVQSS